MDNVNDTLFVAELGKNKRVQVRTFKGTPLVDIREYYEKDNVMLPGKKGISLNKSQFEAILENLDAIKSAMDIEKRKKPKKNDEEDVSDTKNSDSEEPPKKDIKAEEKY